MNWKRIFLIIVPLIIIGLVAFRLRNNKQLAEEKVYHYDKTQPVGVEVDTISLEEIHTTKKYSGTFEPYRETNVNAEIQGKVNSVMVDVGDHVKEGQHLILQDNALLQLQLEAVEIQIEGLQNDVRRYTILSSADAVQGVQLEKAELGLKSAKVQKATLREQINKSAIKAPFDGVVTAKYTEKGAFGAPGVPLLQITDIHLLKFTVYVPERELELFTIGQEYLIRADAFPDSAFTGKTVMIGSQSNKAGSFPVQFHVVNSPGLAVKAGMFGELSLRSEGSAQGYLIPASAVLGSTSEPKVYLIREGKAQLHNIVVATRMESKVAVSKGLKEGDVIVTNGFVNLFDGANVSVK